MRRHCWLVLIVLMAPFLLAGCGSTDQGAVQQTVETVAKATESGLNRRSLAEAEKYFATVEEGGNAAGLQETQQALHQFAASLTSRERIQFHSFDVKSVEVHEGGGLARVTYQLHFSILRDSLVIYGAVVTQDLAMIKTPRGWRISGGDTPQLSEVTGQWPPPGTQSSQ
jgi:predicted small secreted protein